MTSDEIDQMIRRMIGEEQATHVSPEFLTQAKTDAINWLADLLVKAAPEYFEKKVALTCKNTNIHHFEMPSDSKVLKRVWDYDGRVGTVSGAADNGSGAIRLTVDATFAATLADEDRIIAHDVGGTTEANGTWQIDFTTGETTLDLVGSTYANGYTSGGKVFIDSEDTYKYTIDRVPSKYQEADDETHYFYRQDDIIIDDPDFENDIIILYRYLPSTLAEIPSVMHFGIYAFGALMCGRLPDPRTKVGDVWVPTQSYEQIKKNLELCAKLWDDAQGLARDFTPVLGSNNIADRVQVKRWL